jgi:hypothetical protein
MLARPLFIVLLERRTMSKTTSSSVWSERVFPVVRVFFVQLLLMIGIIGNLAGWLIMALLVDKLHWLNIDFHGKTLNTISPDGKVFGFCILFITNLILVVLAWRYLEKNPSLLCFWSLLVISGIL